MTEPTPGLVVVDKPAGWTSHDVVGRMRRIARTRKVGHAGTLDPMATGVLVLGVGRATRLLGHLTLHDKGYLATIRLGASTVTDDAEGDVVATASAAGLTAESVAAGLLPLTGDIEQVPSAVSAVKIDGKRSYARVRAGEDVALPARRVRVSALDVLAVRRVEPFLDVDVSVECSAGTYVRALARDLGAALGVGGHLTALRRTHAGPFALDRAATLEELAARPDPITVPLDEAVATAFPRREVDAEQARVLSHGGRLTPVGISGVHGVFGPDGEVIALVEERDGAARPVLVFSGN